MKLKIIAELGSNWETFDQLLSAPKLAKECGADIVKYQCFSEMDLYGRKCQLRNIPPSFSLLDKMKDKCTDNNIEFMCTAFSPEGYELVNPFVDRHKVASSEMIHPGIWNTLQKLGKPVIMSTGGHELKDVVDVFEANKNIVECVMYCDMEYPSKHHNKYALDEFEHSFSTLTGCNLTGFSDHTIDIYPYYAETLCENIMCYSDDSAYVEKHWNPFKLEHTPDQGHSLDQGEFKKFVAFLRGFASREGFYRTPMRLLDSTHHRKPVAITDIKKGDTLKLSINFDFLRSKDSNRYFSYKDMTSIDNKIANRDYKAFEILDK